MADFEVLDVLTHPAAHVATSRVKQSILCINEQSAAEAIFIRLLCGTTKIRHVATGFEWDQINDYSILGIAKSTAKSDADFEKVLLVRQLPIASLNDHLNRSLRQNSFFGDLSGELLHIFRATEAKSHTIAFIHIYRLLERLSFAFPMLYASRSQNYKGAFKVLKDFFGAGDKGELGFLKKFTETTLDAVLLDAHTSFHFASIADARIRKACYSTFKRYIAQDDIDDDVPDTSLKVKNRALLGLLITLRNRFFHFFSDHSDNLSAADVPDSDGLFEVANEQLLNWLATIYFEVLRSQIHN